MRPGEVDAAGPPDVDDLRSSDELLDRLGRREPGASDLDDPLIATLAVLAGDVDLLPVPVSASRRALADVGAWPPPAGAADAHGPARADDADDVHRLAAAVPRLPGTGVPRPSPAPATVGPALRVDVPVAAADPSPDPVAVTRPGRGRPPELVPAFDHPRVLRLRPAIGMAAAAVLAVLGGGLAVSVGLLGPDRSERVRTVGDQWVDQPLTDVTRDALSRRLDDAAEALRAGDPPAARAILTEVTARLAALPPEDRSSLSDRVSALRRALGGAPGPATSAGGVGTPASAAAGDGRAAGSGRTASRARSSGAVATASSSAGGAASAAVSRSVASGAGAASRSMASGKAAASRSMASAKAASRTAAASGTASSDATSGGAGGAASDDAGSTATRDASRTRCASGTTSAGEQGRGHASSTGGRTDEGDGSAHSSSAHSGSARGRSASSAFDGGGSPDPDGDDADGSRPQWVSAGR